MTYNINALLPIAAEVIAISPRMYPVAIVANGIFEARYPALWPSPTYDEWIAAFEQLERESTAENDLSDLEDDGEPIPTPISCSICQRPTTFDPTYGDLCYRCCRVGNE